MADYSLGTARGEVVIGSDTKGADEAGKSLDAVNKKGVSAGQALGKVGGVMTGAGLAIAAGFAYAVKSAADFEQRMSAVQAVSGASQKEMDALSAKALQLGKDTAFSATDAATAIEELVKAGISVPDVMNGAADATVALAAAGEVSLPAAATLAANAMNSFGLSAKEMPKVADLIAGAANASAIDVGEFGTALQQVGAVAHLAGVPFSDTATAIALLGNAGIKGSDAGTSLKTMFQRLIPTTDKAKSAMEKLGIITEDGTNRFFDQHGKIKSLADVSQILQTSLKGMSKEQKLATLQTLFGSDAIRGAAILADNGAAGFDKMATAMGKVKAADVAKTRMDNLKGSLEQMKGSLETAGIAVGQILLPAIKSIIGFVTGLLNKFLGLSKGTQTVIVVILAIAAAFLIVVGGILLFTALILAAIPVVTAFAGAMVVAWAAITGPIGLVVIAIIALVAIVIVLWKHCETFRNIVKAVWAAIVAAFQAAVSWITGTAVPAVVGAWNAIVSAAQAMASWLVGVWDTIKSAVSTAIDFIVGIWTSVSTTTTSVWGAILSFIQDVWAKITAAAQAFWDWLVAVFGPGLTTIWDGLLAGVELAKQAFQTVSDWVGVQVETIKTFLNDAWAMLGPPLMAAIGTAQAIFSGFVTVVSAIIAGLVIGFQATWSAIQTAFSAVVAFMSAAWNGFVAVINVVWGLIKAGFAAGVAGLLAVWNGFIAVLQAVWSVIGGPIIAVVTAMWNTLKAVFSTAMAFVTAIIQTGWNTIQAIIQGVQNVVMTIISAGWNAIVGIIKGVWTIISGVISGALNIILGIIKVFIAVVTGNWSQAWAAIQQIIKGAFTIINSIVKGAMQIIGSVIKAGIAVAKSVITAGWNVIKTVTSGVWNAIKSLISTVWSAIKSVISAGISVINSVVRTGLNTIKGIFTAAWNAVKSGVTSAWNGIKSGISTGISAVMGLITGLKGKITGFFSGAGSWLLSAGRAIIDGLARGVTAAGQKVVDAAKRIAQKVKDIWPGSPVKEGPLRSLNHGHAGKEIVRMLADGIEKEGPRLNNLMLGLAGAAVNPAGSVAGNAGRLDLSAFKPAAAAGNNFHIENVTIPAADLAEMRGVADFFNRVQQEARRINPRLKMGA